MRLIDADLIIELLEKEKARDDCKGGWYSTVCSFIRLLEAAPTVTLRDILVDDEEDEEDE